MAVRKKGRKGRKKAKRMTLDKLPTQRTIALTAGEAGQAVGVVHVSNLLSQQNSRLYRQGMVYDVQFQLQTPTDDPNTQINLYTLPNTWFTHGAIKHAFKAWRASLQDELSLTGGKTSKWLDFRVKPEADGTPNSNIFYPNFWDGNSWNAVSTGYEQGYSYVQDADSDVMYFQAGSEEDKSGAGQYNIFLEYARDLLSRKADDSAEGGPQSYEGLIGDAEDIDRVMEDGDTPPYDEDFEMWHLGADASTDQRLVFQDSIYVGIHDSDNANARAQGSRIVSRTFSAPLGLVFVSITGGTSTFATSGNSEMALIVKPGKYKGVSARPIFHFDMLGATAKSLR